MVSKRSWLAITVVLGGSSGAVTAMDQGGVPVGPFRAYPSVSYDLKHDDNILRTDTDTQSSWAQVITPAVELKALSGPNAYTVGARLSKGWYNRDGDRNDYLHKNLSAQATMEAALRHHFELKYDYADMTDSRSGDLNPYGDLVRDTAASNDVDRWHHNQANVTYTFGAPNSRGKIDIHGGRRWLRYDNNNQQFRDRNVTDVDATLYARVMPKTSVLAEVAQSTIDYINKSGPATLDSAERRYLVGLTWDATAKTSGALKAGYLTKHFDDSTIDDFSGTSWELGVTWRPLTYSTVEVTAARTTSDAASATDYALAKLFGIAWSHQWTNRLRTKFDVQWEWDDYRVTDRKEDFNAFGLALTYAITHWLDIGASYRNSTRDSSLAGLDYTDNVYVLTLDAAL